MAAGWRLPDSRNLSDNLSGPPNTKEGTMIMEKEFKPDIYLLLNQWMTDLRPFLFRQKKFRFLSVFEFLHFRRNFRFFGFWRLREEGKFFEKIPRRFWAQCLPIQQNVYWILSVVYLRTYPPSDGSFHLNNPLPPPSLSSPSSMLCRELKMPQTRSTRHPKWLFTSSVQPKFTTSSGRLESV